MVDKLTLPKLVAYLRKVPGGHLVRVSKNHVLYVHLLNGKMKMRSIPSNDICVRARADGRLN